MTTSLFTHGYLSKCKDVEKQLQDASNEVYDAESCIDLLQVTQRPVDITNSKRALADAQNVLGKIHPISDAQNIKLDALLKRVEELKQNIPVNTDPLIISVLNLFVNYCCRCIT